MKEKEGESLRLGIWGTGKTIEETADILNISRGTLYNYFKMGRLPEKFKEDVKKKLSINFEQNVQNSLSANLVLTVTPYVILENARIQKGFTQSELAEKVGIKLEEYQIIERGDYKHYHQKTIKAIDKVLGTDLNQIIYEKKYNTANVDNSYNNFMKVPYLPIYAQSSYLSHYAHKSKVIDSDLEIMVVPKESDKDCYMVIEILGNSMNDKTYRAICDEDKLLIKEINMMGFERESLDYKNKIFVLFTANNNIICRQIVAHNIKKSNFTLHAWNKTVADFDINTNEVYRLFYVKSIFNRKVNIQ